MAQRYYVPNISRCETVHILGDEAHHAVSVMRVKSGSSVILFDGNNHEAQATVQSVSRKEVVCRIDQIAEVDREAQRMMIVAVALPKGDRARSVIEKAVELGAWGLVPLVCRRSVALPSDGQFKRLHRYVIDASKQCGRNRLMQIGSAILWPEFLAASIGDLFPSSNLNLPFDQIRLIAHPSGTANPQAGFEPMIFAVGPEGGFDDDEVRRAIDSGWSTVTLGPRILRVETAVGALLSISQ